MNITKKKKNLICWSLMRIVQSICNYLQLTNHMSSKFRLHWEALAFYPVCILLFFHFEWYYIVWWYCIHNLWSPWQTIGMIFRGKLLIHHVFDPWSVLLSQNVIVLCENYLALLVLYCYANLWKSNYMTDFSKNAIVELHADFQIIKMFSYHHLNDLKWLINTFP